MQKYEWRKTHTFTSYLGLVVLGSSGTTVLVLHLLVVSPLITSVVSDFLDEGMDYYQEQLVELEKVLCESIQLGPVGRS